MVNLLLHFRLFFAAVAGPLRVPGFGTLVGLAAASLAISVDMVREVGGFSSGVSLDKWRLGVLGGEWFHVVGLSAVLIWADSSWSWLV
jgi:hypothetical protein